MLILHQQFEQSDQKRIDLVQNVIVPAQCYTSEIIIESEFKLGVNLTGKCLFGI